MKCEFQNIQDPYCILPRGTAIHNAVDISHFHMIHLMLHISGYTGILR